MNSEIRNQLIELMYIAQNSKDAKYVNKGVRYVIDRIEADLHKRIRDAKGTIEECESNLEILEEVKKGIKVEE